jgi:hypothetical protein
MYITDTSPGRMEVRIRTSDSAWSYTYSISPDRTFAYNSWTAALPLQTTANQITSAIVEIRLWNMSSTAGQWNSSAPPVITEWTITSIASKR